jgi:hypothetical protein
MTKYLIFNSDGYLKKIAETDDEKNQLLQYSYIAQSCADQKFEDIKKNKITAKIENDNVVYSDLFCNIEISLNANELARPEEERQTAAQVTTAAIETIKSNINYYIEILEQYLNQNNDEYWSTYLTALKNIDQNTIVTPSSEGTFEEWLFSQPNFPQKSLLQLP